MAYLNELHPEIYQISPRPGGLAKIELPKSSKRVRMSFVSEKSSKATNRSIGKSSMSGKSSYRSFKGSIGGTSGRSSRFSAFDAPFLTSTPDKASREYRIQKVLETSQWVLPDEEDEEEGEIMPIRCTDPVANEITILSVAISTIMLMAVRYNDINRDHLKWTLSYLECIKDDFGNTPPNVRGILNNIRLIDDTLESFLESEVEIVDGSTIEASTGPIPEGEEKETAVSEPAP